MHMMSANGIAIHLSDTGEQDRTTLVFSNSLGTDFRIWDRVVPGLSRTFRIVRYDKRGHGLSEAPASPYDMADHVGDLEAVLDGLGIEKAIVAGLSVGGMIAQGLAAKRPDLVRALILMDTAARIGSVELWNERIDAVRGGGIEAIADGVLQRWFPARFAGTRPAERAGWRAMLTRTPVEGYIGTMMALRDTDLTDQTATLTVPTLAICGADDAATPPELVRATAGLIPGARYVEVPNAGHLPCIDQSEAVVQAMSSFFKEHGFV